MLGLGNKMLRTLHSVTNIKRVVIDNNYTHVKESNKHTTPNLQTSFTKDL